MSQNDAIYFSLQSHRFGLCDVSYGIVGGIEGEI